MKPQEQLFPGLKRPLLFGHRGLSSRAPENTMAAFHLAKEENIPGIELDIHLCASGELVVFHDDTAKRITGKDISLEPTDYSQLKKLDIGEWFSKSFKGEHIPLLQDVFDLMGHNMYVDIEIKSRSKENSAICTKLMKVIKEFKMEENCLISSFNPLALREFGNICPSIQTAIIYCNDKELPFYLRSGFGQYIGKTPILKPDRKLVTLNKTKKQQKRGKLVIPWTVDDLEEMERLLDAGVNGLISNKPDILNQALLKKNGQKKDFSAAE